MGPAERSAAAAGIEGPHEWTDLTVELHAVDVHRWRLVVLDGGRELGRAAVTPSMIESLTSQPPSQLMVRLMRAAPLSTRPAAGLVIADGHPDETVLGFEQLPQAGF